MYTPSGSFEAQRYGEMYGFDPNASKRDLRRQGRQFKRYLKTDAADYDRQVFEAAEQARREGDMRAASNRGAQELAARMRTPLQIDTTGAMERMNAGFEATDARRAELAEQDLNSRIAGAARFNDAFRMARQAGLKTFTWKGNLYGTELAQPGSSAGRGSGSGAGAGAGAESGATPTGRVVQDPRRTMHNAMDANPGDFVPGRRGVPSSREQVVGGYGDTQTREQRLPEFDLNQFARANGLTVDKQYGYDVVRWDPDGFGDFYIDSKGRIFHGGSTFNNTKPYELKGGLGYGESKRHYDALQAAIAGVDNNSMKKGIKINVAPAPKATNQTYTNPPYRAVWKKNGGFMPRLKYFQQGGAMQGDVMSQVQALVQAAAQGDEQATQQITQIMEAAKSGDQQAMQIAQIMEQVIKELQGKAAAAKWGAKLGYIKSLKYAKGGKTCPACEKKVEMKACGGKKAKKHQEGGNVQLVPKVKLYRENLGNGYVRETIPHADSDVRNAFPRRLIYISDYYGDKPDTLYFSGHLEETNAGYPMEFSPNLSDRSKYGPKSDNERWFNSKWEQESKKAYLEKFLKQ